ncbi:hypothetical protein GCM10023189_57450 [Nibrella saemangeumensis]|uniref:Uncharacterized protein n=1 Tax=Nibrella saemangeumensis TaxID=1084526 RepID=A0ABP8NRC6_9BACT
MKRAQVKEYYGHIAIIAILILTQLYSVFVANTTDVYLTSQHYLGFVATASLAILLFVRPAFLFYGLGIILILGVENIIGFTPELQFTSTRWYSGGTALPVAYQNYSLFLFLLWSMFSYQRLAQLGKTLLARVN